eukprot:CAMPEP_0195566934 /NCGR_PEP_ID=MMETSP0814-20130614/1358_1 /TAXON_ID=97485 /ORGANISM="Prymnesium parvum, Strain Texoma1" /LENGTH=108 /DNA_ID=CAMNT_0040702101 /DNA_START=706 /DNA_END=1030 /DNA_ORIENTATION=+
MVRGGQGGGADGDWLIRDDRRASEREAVRLREKMHPASLRADAECVEAPEAGLGRGERGAIAWNWGGGSPETRNHGAGGAERRGTEGGSVAAGGRGGEAPRGRQVLYF